MELITQDIAFKPAATAVAIGMFDGLHRGHRSVLTLLRATARAAGLPTVLVTFDPHPRALLRPGDAPLMLTNLASRLDLIAATGLVDHCLVLPFDRLLASRTAEEFVDTALVDRLRIRSLVVGSNFCCGAGRQGNVDFLRSAGASRGFEVTAVPLSRLDDDCDVACSSTQIRRLIREGDVGAAARALHRAHEVQATVVTRHATRILVELAENMCIPASGTFAVGLNECGARGLSKGRGESPATGLIHLDNHRRACIEVPPGSPVLQASKGQALQVSFLAAQAASLCHGESSPPMARPALLS